VAGDERVHRKGYAGFVWTGVLFGGEHDEFEIDSDGFGRAHQARLAADRAVHVLVVRDEPAVELLEERVCALQGG
jgi:hypothetical protein